ncbi:hypothetical protein ACQKM9_17390 [Viridibacillus sp. NPDC093762]|uniref:ParM/StbA family protein n=1 Tax=Viridibacillus sp. NPDC093762 TaxID=3390720 RepID=UPI003D0364E0
MSETVEYVSIDFGYGYLKAISSTGKRIIFPSLIGEGYESQLSNETEGIGFGETADIDNMSIKVDNQIYLVGKSAEQSEGVTRNFTKEDRYNDKLTKILINVAIQLVSDGKSDKIYLFTGLPLDFYSTQAKFANTFTGVQSTIEWLSGGLKGQKISNNIEKTLVFPQGASAIMAALINHEGKYTYPELMRKGNVLALIDIGFRTTDYIVVEVQKNGSIVPRMKQSGTHEKGIIDLRNALKTYFKGKTGGTELREYQLENKALFGEPVRYKNEYIPFKDELERTKKSITKNIVDKLNQVWKGESDMFDKIFVAGGGGSDFINYLNPYFNGDLTKIEEYHFANAIGYLRLGKAIIRKKEVI